MFCNFCYGPLVSELGGAQSAWCPPNPVIGGRCPPGSAADVQLYLLSTTYSGRGSFAGSVGHPMTKMLSASGGAKTRGSAPGPRWGLVLHTRHGAPQPLTPSAAYAY